LVCLPIIMIIHFGKQNSGRHVFLVGCVGVIMLWNVVSYWIGYLWCSKILGDNMGKQNVKFVYVLHVYTLIIHVPVTELSCQNWSFEVFQLEFWSENWRFFVDIFMCSSVQNLQLTFYLLCFKCFFFLCKNFNLKLFFFFFFVFFFFFFFF
jgi:hypothetical protein